MHKRFPNQWSIVSKVWTPHATRVEVSGLLQKEAGELILAILCNPKPTPAMLKAMRDLTECLDTLAKAKKAKNG